jgi:hypothetical protein
LGWPQSCTCQQIEAEYDLNLVLIIDHETRAENMSEPGEQIYHELVKYNEPY